MTSLPAHRVGGALVSLMGWLLLLFLLVPLAGLVLSTGAGDFLRGLGHPAVWPAIRLSLVTSLSSLAIVVVLGTALAWRLARSASAGVRSIEVLLQLPVVVPPAVAGLAMLIVFGRAGPFAPLWSQWGLHLAFTPVAVVLAQIFVSAPFFVLSAVSAFRRLDPSLLAVARSLGAGPHRAFFRIALPLCAPALVSGAAVSWARAMGEFGATLLFAGNSPGRTQTLPLAVYATLETDLPAAQALSVVMIGMALLVLVALRVMGPRSQASDRRL